MQRGENRLELTSAQKKQKPLATKLKANPKISQNVKPSNCN
jgi:hypothetical protein